MSDELAGAQIFEVDEDPVIADIVQRILSWVQPAIYNAVETMFREAKDADMTCAAINHYLARLRPGDPRYPWTQLYCSNCGEPCHRI